MAIQVGNIVWLKTGGAKMGVSEMRNSAAVCVWQDKGHKPHKQEYAIDLLTEIEPEESELIDYLPDDVS